MNLQTLTKANTERLCGDEVDVQEADKELADIVIYADLLASRLGLDLGGCVRDKFNEVSDRVHSSIKI